MQIIDDAIPKEYQDFLETLLLNNSHFPYYYEYNTVIGVEEEFIGNSDDNIIMQPQFVHKFYDCGEILSTAYDNIMHIFDGTGIESLSPIRLKVNLLHSPFDRSKGTHHIPHIDNDNGNHISFIYYVNDSDGDTYLFDKVLDKNSPIETYKRKVSNLKIKKRVSPKKGRILIFDSNRFHASSPPLNHPTRCVINMVFKES